MSKSDARAEIGKWLDDCKLTREFELHFANPKIGTATVAEILAEPDDYVGEDLYDLFEDPSDPDTRCDRTRVGAARMGGSASGRSTEGGRSGCWRTGAITSLRISLPISLGQARSFT